MILYTDGACSGNGTPNARASWAFLEHEQGEIIFEDSGVIPQSEKQSNNTGELQAILQAMAYAIENQVEWCIIFSDSLYAINSITLWDIEKRVKGERKSNYGLIKSCQNFLINSGINFQLLWVKGHSVDVLNGRVDELAVEALKLGEKKVKAKYICPRFHETVLPRPNPGETVTKGG